MVPKGPTGGSMSNRFFPCKTQTRSKNQRPFDPNRTCSGVHSAPAAPQQSPDRGPGHLTWSSASSSSRSSPVAMGMTSSTLAGLSPAAHPRGRRHSISARRRQGIEIRGEGILPYLRGAGWCGGRRRPPRRAGQRGLQRRRAPRGWMRRRRRRPGAGRGLGFGRGATWWWVGRGRDLSLDGGGGGGNGDGLDAI